MPSYPNNPFTATPLGFHGLPLFLFGSYNFDQSNPTMSVSNVALTSNVATLTVQVIEGPLPVVGALVSVKGTTSTAGLFNVSRIALTGVTLNANGAGTITFALTHADVISAADSGLAVAELLATPETLANGNSIACAYQPLTTGGEFTIPTDVYFPSLPTACTVNLQQAMRNIDADFTTMGAAATVAGGVQTVGPIAQFTLTRGYFYRFQVTGVSGGSSPTIVAKIG